MLPRIKKLEFRHAHIDDQIYTDNDIFLHSNGHEATNPSKIFTQEDFAKMLLHDPQTIIFGTGFKDKVEIERSVFDSAKKLNIELVMMPTSEAAKKFHEYSRQGRKTIAKLHITC